MPAPDEKRRSGGDDGLLLDRRTSRLLGDSNGASSVCVVPVVGRVRMLMAGHPDAAASSTARPIDDYPG